VSAVFSIVPQRLDPTPDPALVREMFKALDQTEAAARELRRHLDACRQQHMARTRCWGITLEQYRREIGGA